MLYVGLTHTDTAPRLFPFLWWSGLLRKTLLVVWGNLMIHWCSVLSKNMVILRSPWCWDKWSFLYSTLYLKLIVFLPFSSELASTMLVCWSVKSAQVFSTREKFVFSPQIVQIRSIVFRVVDHRSMVQCKAGVYTTCSIHKGQIAIPFCLSKWQSVSNIEWSTSCQWVESTGSMKTSPILMQYSKLLLWKYTNTFPEIYLWIFLQYNFWQ